MLPFVDKHILHKMLQSMTDRPIFYISGSVSAEERERIRLELNNHTNAILLASVQTTSTGINIPALDNIIFASPTKSIFRVLQSIGRVLRLKDGKVISGKNDIKIVVTDKLENVATFSSNFIY